MKSEQGEVIYRLVATLGGITHKINTIDGWRGENALKIHFELAELVELHWIKQKRNG